MLQAFPVLAKVKDTRINRLTISVKSKALDEATVSDLLSLVEEKPGRTELYFNVDDEETGTKLLLRATTKRVEVGKQLVEYVDGRQDMTLVLN